MLAALDTTAQQFSADGLLLLLVAANAAIGWRTGTLRRILAFAGLYVGVIAAYYTGNGLASLVHKGDIFANAWAFVGIFTVVVIAFEFVGRIFADRLDRLALVIFDRVGGLVIGATVGFFQALVLFWVALSVGAAPSLATNHIPPTRDAAATAVKSATLSGAAVSAEPAVSGMVAPLMSTDLSAHLQDGTGTGAIAS